MATSTSTDRGAGGAGGGGSQSGKGWSVEEDPLGTGEAYRELCKPDHYYSRVWVCRRCYNVYSRLDKSRLEDIDTSTDLLTICSTPELLAEFGGLTLQQSNSGSVGGGGFSVGSSSSVLSASADGLSRSNSTSKRQKSIPFIFFFQPMSWTSHDHCSII